MSTSAATPDVGGSRRGTEGGDDVVRLAGSLWWIWLVAGVAWMAVALVVLQFDEASIKTVGAIVGVMFVVSGLQQLVLGALADSLRWLWAAFGLLLITAVNPLWWLVLASGLVMVLVAFWTSGQFFIERAYLLLVFAGVWALMHGLTDITRPFALRSLRD